MLPKSSQNLPSRKVFFRYFFLNKQILDTIIVDGLPKTRSGKIMRRILRKLAASQVETFAEIAPELGDISTLAEPEVVEEIFLKKCQS